MLIVIIIIGVLAGSLVPRLTSYMERTRDLKRQSDLRNLATAISQYKDDMGEFPLREMTPVELANLARNTLWRIWYRRMPREYGVVGEFYGTVWGLQTKLSDYIKAIPHDPWKSLRVCITWNCYTHFSKDSAKISHKSHPIRKGEQEIAAVPGEYMYWLQRDKKAAMLITRVETPNFANYVIVDVIKENRNGFSGNTINYGPFDIINKLDTLHLCSSVKKVPEWEEKFEIRADWIVDCAFSHEEQLYYLHPIF